MVKGVNKTIIEINNTGSKYFDRVVFYINPSYTSLPRSKLESKAGDIIRSAEPVMMPQRKKGRHAKRGQFLLPLALIAAAIIFLLVK